ncbi:MAG: transposase [Patescibacteria group bacterium]
MGNRNLYFATGEYYHIYQRGNNKKEIFYNESDRLRFLALLYAANASMTIHLSDYWEKNGSNNRIFTLPRGETLIDIGAYCLMPNHFHLLVYEKTRGGISSFMQKLNTGYSMYFNKRHERTGSLLERPFRAQHISNDDYLRYLFAYIHLNPVKVRDPESWSGKKIKNPNQAKIFLENYRFSSYLYYVGQTSPENTILENKNFPDYFKDKQDFNSFINDWLTIGGED